MNKIKNGRTNVILIKKRKPFLFGSRTNSANRKLFITECYIKNY